MAFEYNNTLLSLYVFKEGDMKSVLDLNLRVKFLT